MVGGTVVTLEVKRVMTASNKKELEIGGTLCDDVN